MPEADQIVNISKREVVNPWDLGGVAKFWKWVDKPQTGVFPWLLRQSNQGGGGDIDERDRYQTLGRWAGDRIVLIGDYDSSRLYFKASKEMTLGKEAKSGEYTDISGLLRQEFNDTVERDGRRGHDLL